MKRLLWTTLGILVIISLVLVGCGEKANPTSTTSAAPPPPSKITIAANAEPDRTEICSSTGQPATTPIMANVFETLLDLGDAGAFKPVLATAWELTPDGMSFTMTLRKGVTFSNGDPLTTKDVLFTNVRAGKNPGYASYIKNVDRIEAIDDYNFKIIMKTADLGGLNWIRTGGLFFIVSKTYFDRVGEDVNAANPVGTGPYKMVNWVRGQYMDFVANDTYWGPKPQVKEARIIFAKEDTTRLAMLQTGEVDMITDTPWGQIPSIKTAGFKTISFATSPNEVLVFNLITPNTPWSKKEVRQAIAYALDRKSLINNVFNGIPGYDAWLTPVQLGYDPNMKPYPYDVAKAKQLLTAAGYPNGFDMPFYYWTNQPIAGVKEIADYIVTALKAVNINCVNITGLDSTAMTDQLRKWHSDPKAAGGASLIGRGLSGSEPAAGAVTVFSSTGATSIYANPALDALLSKALATMDTTVRADITKQAFALINEELPGVNILANNSVYSMKSNIDYKIELASFRMVWLKNITMK